MADAAARRGEGRHSLALPALVLGVSLLCACGGEEGSPDPGGLPIAGTEDDRLLPAALVTTHDDLPGVQGFADLGDDLKAAVLARANGVACSCGCLGHSLARCLNQREPCEVSLRLVGGFVSDARASAWAAAPGGAEAKEGDAKGVADTTDEP